MIYPTAPCSLSDVDWFLSEPQVGAFEALKSLEGDVLVLGAGGKMGLHLCLLLRRAFDALGKTNRVLAASRFQTLNAAALYEKHGIETLSGDFSDAEFLESLPSCPTVIYMAGVKFGTTNNPGLLQEINVELPRRVADRFRDSRIIAFSTGCVYAYASPDSGGSTEDSPLDPIGDYAQSCVDRERRFMEASEAFGTPVVLIRLNYSVEFRYGVLLDIGQKVMREESVDVTMGHVNVIWQNDAINQIAQCMNLAASPAVPINITGPDTLAVRDLAERFGRRFGKSPRFVGSEAETMWLSNASKSHDLFGKPAVDVDTMIDWVSAWLLAEGPTHGKPTGFEKRDGKF